MRSFKGRDSTSFAPKLRLNVVRNRLSNNLIVYKPGEINLMIITTLHPPRPDSISKLRNVVDLIFAIIALSTMWLYTTEITLIDAPKGIFPFCFVKIVSLPNPLYVLLCSYYVISLSCSGIFQLRAGDRISFSSWY